MLFNENKTNSDFFKRNSSLSIEVSAQFIWPIINGLIDRRFATKFNYFDNQSQATSHTVRRYIV